MYIIYIYIFFLIFESRFEVTSLVDILYPNAKRLINWKGSHRLLTKYDFPTKALLNKPSLKVYRWLKNSMFHIIFHSYQKLLILHNSNFKTKLKRNHTPSLSLLGSKIHKFRDIIEIFNKFKYLLKVKEFRNHFFYKKNSFKMIRKQALHM